MIKNHHEFNKGTEFWLGRYYDTSNLCLVHNDLVEKFGDYIVNIFKNHSVKEELCALIDEKFKIAFSGFKDSVLDMDRNCFEEGEIHYDKKFKYIRLPNFKSEFIKNFQLRISINPCLANDCAMTKIYCNSLLHESVLGEISVDFYKRSKILCETVLLFVTNIYSYYFFEFIKNQKIVSNNKCKTNEFDGSFSLTSTFIGSNDTYVQNIIDNLKQKSRPLITIKKDIQYLLLLLNETNRLLNNNFTSTDYKWSYIDVVDAKNTRNKAIIGYAENDYNGHLVGLSNNIPRKILLPLHVKFISEN